MSQILRLRGGNALSAFRSSRLVSSLRSSVSRVTAAHAEYRHFVELARALSDAEARRLDRILAYGPAEAPAAARGDLMLVVPRFGTISPWSSKATDIAHHCGLEAVRRIERGVAYFISMRDGEPFSASDRLALAPLIHDRMTETVLGSLEDADRLFEHFAPKP